MTLEQDIDKLFIKERHGMTTHAILKEVRKKKVVLSCPKRQDSYTISLAEFKKHYHLAATG